VANEVSVDLILNTKSDAKGFKKIEGEAKKAGEEAGKGFGKGFELSAAGIAKAGAVAVVAAGAAITLAFKKGIAEAANQENAINRLNTALQITGKFSQQTSQDLQNFASQLQATTKFGDDAVISTAAYIQQLANLDTQGLKKATVAATDLASALRIDLESAGTLVAKSIEGNTAALSRYGIKVQQGANETETLANVLTAIESKFGGSAQAEINTYAGAIAQASNSYGDLFEELGNFIVKSPIVISLIKDARDAFNAGAQGIATFRQNFNAVEDLINPLSSFADGVITFVVAPLELIGNIGVFAFNKIVEGVAAAVSVIGGFGVKLAEFLGKFGVDNELTQGLKTFGETSNQVFIDAANTASASFQSILDFPIADGLAVKNEEIRANLASRNTILKEENNKAITEATDQAVGLTGIVGGIYDGLINKTSEGVKKTNEQIAAFSKRTGEAIRNGVGVSAANGFAAFGKALAEGENATKAFEKAFIQSIGQVAVQQGTAFILEGTALLFRPGFQGVGAGMIAAGATLAALGGALGAGSSSKPSVGGGGISANADTQVVASPETLTQPDEVAQRSESGPRVQVTIQGNVFDTDETGNRIIDIINANFETKGNSFNNARFA
jgi:hypothetical protein